VPEAAAETAEIVDTTLDGRGVARCTGKTAFVAGALSGETVRFRRRRRRRNYDEAELLEVLQPSSDRVEPRCAVFGICGACSLQHLSGAAQLALKQATLLDNLDRIGGVQPARVLDPVTGPVWGYRRKARLAVKDVPKKGRVLVGFREQGKPYVTDTRHCATLHPSVGERLEELSVLIGGLSIRSRLPQIEVAVGDDATALVFRVLDPPSDDDLHRLREFGAASGFRLFLQSGGPDSIVPLPGAADELLLHYRLSGFGLELAFKPTDFVQVNAGINERMLELALELLAPTAQSRVLDLFCGLGNFSLPLARQCAEVLGVEGDADMVARAGENAANAGLANTRFATADLTDPESLAAWKGETFDRVLLDPPRSGAAAVLPVVAAFAPARLVYVSCHPGTLARDAGQLSKEYGYRLTAAGIMDMFPQTSHVESIALFERA